MGKYAEDARQLLRLVGGKENIAAVSHCMTRMRFALADPEKADVKAIEALKSVKGSFTQSGQFQVIIGNTVADFYNEFVKTAGLRRYPKTRSRTWQRRTRISCRDSLRRWRRFSRRCSRLSLQAA